LAAKIDALFKLGIIASLLIAATGVAYYYVLYLPGRDARFEQQRASQQLLAYGQVRAAQEYAAAERQQADRRQAVEKAQAGTRYQTCLEAARVRHGAAWATACRRLAEQAVHERADCLAKSNLSQVYCDAAYRMRDGSATCTLPVEAAADLDGDLNIARNRCLRDREAALH
jgi:hypothetical protein